LITSVTSDPDMHSCESRPFVSGMPSGSDDARMSACVGGDYAIVRESTSGTDCAHARIT